MKGKILIAASWILSIGLMAACDRRASHRTEKQYWHWEKYETLDRLHDDEKQVTCWRFSPQSLSCIPDSQLPK